MTILFDASRPEAQPSPDDWDYRFVETLDRGIDLSRRPETLGDSQAVSADNIRFDQGRAINDTGYKTFGGQVRGSPRASFQFFLKNGSSILVLVTNSTFYRWSESVLEWQYPSDGTKTTLTTASGPSDTTLEVNSIAGFSDGDFIGVALDGGKQHQTTISGAPSGSIITMADGIPSGENAAIGNEVVRALDLAGSDDIPVSVVTWPATDKMYFANGADTPKEFNGTDVTTMANLPSSGNTVARIIRILANHLILMHTIEGGTVFPQRVRWTEPGVDDNWNESVNFNDIYDSEDFIVAAENLANSEIIYRERSIYRMEFLGLSDQTWQFTRAVDAEGAINQDSVINLGDEHIFMGNSNVYSYDGGFSLEPIGDPIFNKIFSQLGELNPEFHARVHGVYVEEIDEALWFYPSGSDTFPKDAIRLKVSTRAWSFRQYPIDIVGFGFFQSQGDLAWQDALGSWADFIGPWLSKAVQSNAPTLHLLSRQDLRVYEYDYITTDDNGTAISYQFVTKDYYVPNRDLRFDRYDFQLRGTTILIEASYDQGVTWETLGTVSPGNVFSRQRLFKQRVGRFIRFRFTGSNGFGLEWLGFKFKREAIWGP